MPVRVDDGGDRLPRIARDIENLPRVFGMTAGVEDDETIAAIEDDRIAVRLRSRCERTGDQMNAGWKLQRGCEEERCKRRIHDKQRHTC